MTESEDSPGSDDSQADTPVEMPMISGKVVIITIVTVALAMSGFAWWNSYRVGSRTRELWGVENARLIRYAPEATLTKFDDAGGPAATVSADGAGWIHARDALIRDTAYDWTGGEAKGSDDWGYKIVFEEKTESFTLLVNIETGLIEDIASKRQGTLTPETREAIAKFFMKQFSKDSGENDKD